MVLNPPRESTSTPSVSVNPNPPPDPIREPPESIANKVRKIALESFKLMPLTAGERLGPYEILSGLGAGGMGEVYKARDTRLDRIVAIKVSKEQFSERFEREARTVAALNHPNIFALHDVGPNYLVMEYLEGEPLRCPQPLEQGVRDAV